MKTETITLRVEPEIKEAMRIAAKRDRRSMTGLIEVLVEKHCDEVGIEIAYPGEEKKNAKSKN